MTVKFPNLRHLRAFKEVAERRSISEASGHVHLSQPAVTQAISGLERDFGLDLFERRPDGMSVTPAGEIFLFRIQRLFSFLEHGAGVSAGNPSRRNKRANRDFYKMASASQLRAFIAIWDTGSFSLAARKIGISQPSVHRAGRDLEKLAGQEFFRFNNQGIELTPAAEHFAQAVKLAYAELQQAFDEIALVQGRDSTKIMVGSLPLSRTSILPRAIHNLLQENHGVQVRSLDGTYAELLRRLRYGDLDCIIGALRSPAPTDDVDQELLFMDSLKLVAGSHHPLVGRKDLTLSDAAAYPWIAPPKETPSGTYLFQTLKIDELPQSPIRIVASSLVLVRGLMLQGEYITVMSERQMAVEVEQGLMVPLDIAIPDSERPIGLTIRKGWKPTITQARFIELLRKSATES